MTARQFGRLLERELGYAAVPGRGKGSHEVLSAPGRPQLIWAFHRNRELSPIEIGSIRVKQVHLSLREAQEVTDRA